jgi:hypothetical protein
MASPSNQNSQLMFMQFKHYFAMTIVKTVASAVKIF